MKKIKATYEILNRDKIDGMEILKEIEVIGRTCYKSENFITEDSAKKFVAMIIKHGHEAVVEHSKITVKFIVDRGVTHEVVRHRMASYAQESQRYCNYSKDKFDNQITYIDLRDGMEVEGKLTVEQMDAIMDEWIKACIDAEQHYFKMLELGATPQIARSVLNNSTKTELIVSMNIREWRHFFKLRGDISAHPQMREVVIPLLKDMQQLIPVVFDDINF